MDASALGMPDVSEDHRSRLTESEASLRRIAGVLGCSVDSFRSDVGEGNAFAGMSELLRLWLAIGDADARSEILTLARNLARA